MRKNPISIRKLKKIYIYIHQDIYRHAIYFGPNEAMKNENNFRARDDKKKTLDINYYLDSNRV